MSAVWSFSALGILGFAAGLRLTKKSSHLALLDFFDRCPESASLHPPPAALRRFPQSRRLLCSQSSKIRTARLKKEAGHRISGLRLLGPSGETRLHFRSVGTKIEAADNVCAVGAAVHRTAATEIRVSHEKETRRHGMSRSCGFGPSGETRTPGILLPNLCLNLQTGLLYPLWRFPALLRFLFGTLLPCSFQAPLLSFGICVG